MRKCTSMFDWDDARYFLAIHRTGTLSAAARDLGVNQSTVGRRLEALEEQLGARLFVRTRDGYSTSPAGEQLLARAESMEEEALAIARLLVGQQERLTGDVRVTSSDAFGPRVVAPILLEFHALHPGIVLEFDTDNRLLSLTRREADIAVRFSRPPDRHLVARKVADFANAPYCSKGYIARRGRPKAPYESQDFVGELKEHLPAARWIEQHAAKGKGRIVFKSSSTFAQHAATLAGLGIAMLPCYLADPEPDLVRIGPPEPAMGRAVWLVVHEDLQRTPRIRACVDFLAQRLGAQSAWFSGKS
jgi:DNA-binding transcriptional LysR family regulator